MTIKTQGLNNGDWSDIEIEMVCQEKPINAILLHNAKLELILVLILVRQYLRINFNQFSDHLVLSHSFSDITKESIEKNRVWQQENVMQLTFVIVMWSLFELEVIILPFSYSCHPSLMSFIKCLKVYGVSVINLYSHLHGKKLCRPNDLVWLTQLQRVLTQYTVWCVSALAHVCHTTTATRLHAHTHHVGQWTKPSCFHNDNQLCPI